MGCGGGSNSYSLNPKTYSWDQAPSSLLEMKPDPMPRTSGTLIPTGSHTEVAGIRRSAVDQIDGAPRGVGRG
jgi:hypothetical protein